MTKSAHGKHIHIKYAFKLATLMSQGFYLPVPSPPTVLTSTPMGTLLKL
ncbi:hypothetical protein PNIG_b0657 [Pseudoalteromonas nigrifaciens]|uniref:Uncharacterized protein n=1 Tax=Pseudoalteromonas nigrifaciens TaxID=28109 RepID=A0AAC9XZL9_9GAMM|nr:hypothetical protein PNIG_b0657 [Pseudoalteromonas nigrifaciens]MBH0091435.1 hypothetical protein [Pseudoalteromonas sp. SCQQ13]SJN21090.1 hypothetical protein CZ797_02425 [Pseudoalteromonas sp. JB197]